MTLHRWNKDTVGTTRYPVSGAWAVVRNGESRMRWSVCRVVGRDLENVVDLRTVRECREWIANKVSQEGEQ